MPGLSIDVIRIKLKKLQDELRAKNPRSDELGVAKRLYEALEGGNLRTKAFAEEREAEDLMEAEDLLRRHSLIK